MVTKNKNCLDIS